MKHVKGDLIALGKAGEFDVIVHGCNCFRTMGAGIAKTIKSEFPDAFDADHQTAMGDESKLGTYSSAAVQIEGHDLIVVNAYTQFQPSGIGPQIDYEAVAKVFNQIKKDFPGKRIGYPAIGAGLAGGDWNRLAEIIGRELEGEDHTFVEFVR